MTTATENAGPRKIRGERSLIEENSGEVLKMDSSNIGSVLPSHWKCNKILPVAFIVVALGDDPKGGLASIAANNEENLAAEPRNATAVVKNQGVRFIETRRHSCGRGETLIITRKTRPPQVAKYCTACRAIKVTIDGQREQRSFHSGNLRNSAAIWRIIEETEDGDDNCSFRYYDDDKCDNYDVPIDFAAVLVSLVDFARDITVIVVDAVGVGSDCSVGDCCSKGGSTVNGGDIVNIYDSGTVGGDNENGSNVSDNANHCGNYGGVGCNDYCSDYVGSNNDSGTIGVNSDKRGGNDGDGGDDDGGGSSEEDGGGADGGSHDSGGADYSGNDSSDDTNDNGGSGGDSDPQGGNQGSGSGDGYGLDASGDDDDDDSSDNSDDSKDDDGNDGDGDSQDGYKRSSGVDRYRFQASGNDDGSDKSDGGNGAGGSDGDGGVQGGCQGSSRGKDYGFYGSGDDDGSNNSDDANNDDSGFDGMAGKGGCQGCSGCDGYGVEGDGDKGGRDDNDDASNDGGAGVGGRVGDINRQGGGSNNCCCFDGGGDGPGDTYGPIYT